MRYSLINVQKEQDGIVDGNWLQDYTGDLKDAVICARETEKLNSNRIDIAVVEAVTGSSAVLRYHKCLRRLDL